MLYRSILMALAGLLACAPASPASETTPPATTTTSSLVGATPQDTAATPVFDLAYLMGHFDPAQHPDFVKVDQRYTERSDFFLHRATYAAFERMYAAALREGIELKVVSATRNFARQKQIWEAKWRGERTLEGGETAPKAYPNPTDRALAILRYSSMPGTSRHHWGTDLDLVELNNEYFAQGKGKRIYDWLLAHAAEYGFCQPYTPKGPERPEGYQEEKWHWSYLPLSKTLTQLAQTQLRNEAIQGFEGAEVAARIDVVGKYVLGINQACQP